MLKLPLATVAVASFLPNLRRTTVMTTNPWLNSNTASNARFQQKHILLPTTSPESSTVNFSSRSEMFSLQTVPKPGSGSGPHNNDNKPVAQPKVNHTRNTTRSVSLHHHYFHISHIRPHFIELWQKNKQQKRRNSSSSILHN